MASYDRALLLNPNYAPALINRGLALSALERFAEALECHDRALVLEPDYPEAWLNRGQSLQQLGHLAEALESYDQALTIQPELAEAHYNRAQVLYSLERADEPPPVTSERSRSTRILPSSIERDAWAASTTAKSTRAGNRIQH